MKWAYGVTTVPGRLNDLLPSTLKSLAAGGFTDPWLFIDGFCSDNDLAQYSDYAVTVHHHRIKTYGNWCLAAWELYIRNSNADRYAIFQDDFVTYKNLRQYLEQCQYPKAGYLNLYTFPQNQKQFQGWYESNQLGKGAVALVFDRAALLAILTSKHWVERPQNEERGWRSIDGGIVTAARKAGYTEYVHNPSLVQHTGATSSMGNKQHDLAPSFMGESFDALSLLGKTVTTLPASRSTKIGLVGYSCTTGLGELHRQLTKYTDIYHWLVRPHPKLQTLEPEYCDFTMCSVEAKVEEFVSKMDVILFCETPIYTNLIALCKRHKKRTVCVPMLEWMTAGCAGWPKDVDLFICPTKQCYDAFKNVVPCVYFPWPVDMDNFQHKPRTVCNRYLFVNGHGGYHGRKGGDTLRLALQAWPEMPVTIIDQTGSQWPGGTVIPSPQNNADLYQHGDVLISPHSVDGIGLEAHEAMASGMPVISTDGLPWNEIPALARIPATVAKQKVRRPVDWYTPQSTQLMVLCKQWLGQDISRQSTTARNWAERMAWPNYVEQFNQLVRKGE